MAKTNEDMMRELMNYSPHGAMCQSFIMLGLRKYCELVLASTVVWPDSSFISQATWKAIAQDILTRLDSMNTKTRAEDDGVTYD